MSNKKKRKPRSKKRKSGEVMSLPRRQAPPSKQSLDRKLSEIIKEMALRLLGEPGADAATEPATMAVLILAGAAWNSAIGEDDLRDRHRELLDQIDWRGVTPRSELRSDDTEQLIAELVEYKRENYPDDRRRVVTTELTSDGNVRVHWAEPSPIVKADFGSTSRKARIARTKHGRPIADKIIRKMIRRARGKVIDFGSVMTGKKNAEDLQKTVATREELADLHPAHAIYAYAQNQTSVMSEQLTALDEMHRFVKLISRAEDVYMPGEPPMSPLTTSFFTCWAFFDACVGRAEETIGTIAMAVGSEFGMHDELLRVIGLMQESRMGVYLHQGVEKGTVVLREFVTDRVCRAISPSGYLGQEGEIWYARVLPPPLAGLAEHVVFCTPYSLYSLGEFDAQATRRDGAATSEVHVRMKPGGHDWQTYFRRTLPDAPLEDRIAAYEHHMKFGPARDYWTDFVLEAYVNHRSDVISLAGLPDVPESRPHSRVNS